MSPDGLLLAVNEAWIDSLAIPEPRLSAIHSQTSSIRLPPYSTRHKAVPELINTTPAMESRSAEYRLIECSGEIADIVLTARPERDPDSGRFLQASR